MARNASLPQRCARARARVCGGQLSLLAIALYALACGRDSRAAEVGSLNAEFAPAPAPPSALLQTHVSADFELPPDFAPAPAARVFSATQFSPHKFPTFGAPPAMIATADATRTLTTTTVWQRLADYRSHDRVRLVTLWETTGSTLSIQAGKRGEPSLQWTSRAMNRGGATRGLLDRAISASLGSAGASPLRNFVKPPQPVSLSMKPAQPLLPSLAKAP